MLHHVEDEIKSNAHLHLAEDPNTNIWAFYIIKVTPVVMEDTLMLILTIPLIDQSLEMSLYRIHNLPMIHPELKIQATYELEGDYFAQFVTLPNPTNVKLCLMTQGHLCMFDQAHDHAHAHNSSLSTPCVDCPQSSTPLWDWPPSDRVGLSKLLKYHSHKCTHGWLGIGQHCLFINKRFSY